MKKSLLLWGALIVVALCFVGCCYYNTTHHNGCAKHCHHQPCCNEKGVACPDAQNADNGGDVETVTVEALEIVPLGNGSNQAPGNNPNAPAAQAPATQTPAAAAPAAQTPAAGN